MRTGIPKWVILALTFVLLAACFFGYSYYQRIIGSKEPENIAGGSPSYWMLYSKKLQDFKSMTVRRKGGKVYTLESSLVYSDSGELLGVSSGNAQPVMLEKTESFVFHENAYKMVMVVAQNLPVTRTIEENAADLEIYGLDDPELTITLSYKSSDDIVIEIGDLIPTGISNYARLGNSSTVYLVPRDLGDIFGNSLESLHYIPGAAAIAKDDILQIRIEQTGKETIEIADKSGPELESSVISKKLYKPFEQDANAERVNELIEGVSGIAPSAFAGYVSAGGDLALYGLEPPSVRIVFLLSNNSVMEYRIGADTEGGMAYIALDRSGDIYLINKSMLSFLQHATVEYLADQFVSLITVKAVDSVKVETHDTAYNFSLVWNKNENNNHKEPEADAYYMNGKQIDKSVFTPMYTKIIGILFDKRSGNDALTAEPAVRIVFALNTEPGEIIVEYLPYDANYYAVRRNGGTHFLVRKEKVDDMVLFLHMAFD